MSVKRAQKEYPPAASNRVLRARVEKLNVSLEEMSASTSRRGASSGGVDLAITHTVNFPPTQPSVADTLGKDTVTIVVGPRRVSGCREYTVHKQVVCAASVVLKRLLESQSSSSPGTVSNELCLHEDWQLVRAFVNLLYGDRVAILNRPRHDVGTNKPVDHFDFFDLYKFGEKYEVDDLRDIAIDALQNELQADGGVDPYLVKRVFPQTTKGPKNKIRRFGTAMSAYRYLVGKDDAAVKWYKDLPDFLEDWFAFQQSDHDKDPTLRLLGVDPRNRVSSNEDNTGFPLCYFHVHPPDHECPSKPNHDGAVEVQL